MQLDPPRMLVRRFLAIAAIAVWHGSTIHLNLGYYDEGLAVVGAERLLHGELPYRDFWSLYAPGNFFYVAATFAAFGYQLLWSRLTSLAAFLGSLWLLELIASRIVSRPWSLPIVVGIGIAAKMPWSTPTTLAMLPVAATAVAVIKWSETAKPAWSFAAGAFACMAAAVRHDFGAYIAAAAFAAMLVDGSPHRRRRRAITLFAAGTLVFGLPVAACCLCLVPWQDVWNDLFVFPATVYPSVRKLPWPDLTSGLPPIRLSSMEVRDLAYRTPFLVGLATPALGCLWVAIAWFRRSAGKAETAGTAAIAICSLTSAVFLFQARTRPDHGHLVPSLMFSMIVLSAAVLRGLRPPIGWPIFVTLLMATTASQIFEKFDDVRAAYWSPTRMAAGLPRARGIVVDRNRDVAVQAIHFVRSATPADSFIFVGNSRHDLVIASSTLCYFLAERRCPNRYQELHPGLTTTVAVQQEIIESLQSKNVELVVLYDESAAPPEPNLSALSSGVHALDEYIRAHYRKIREFGCYHIWIRRVDKTDLQPKS